MTLEEKLKAKSFHRNSYDFELCTYLSDALTICQQEIDEACKKQREICAEEFMKVPWRTRHLLTIKTKRYKMYEHKTLSEIVKQLESCKYECETGALENNIAFTKLKEIADKVSVPLDALVMLQKRKPFTPKFDKGERVWYMKNNRPTEVIISAIEIFYVNTNQDHIKYNATDVINPVTWLDHTNLFEDMLYKTKEELLKTL